jgi:hypothetical protein
METIYTKPQMENLAVFSETLRRIHVRLVAEGVISPDEGIDAQSLEKGITIKNVKEHGKRAR